MLMAFRRRLKRKELVSLVAMEAFVVIDFCDPFHPPFSFFFFVIVD